MLYLTFLEINIHFGTYHPAPPSDSFWMKILPTLISAVVTVFMFFLGQSYSKKREKEKDAERINYVREYFYIDLIKLKLGVKEQIKILNQTIEELQNDKHNSISLYRYINITYDALPNPILNISKTDVFKFFVQERKDEKEKRIKTYSNFYGTLELLKKFSEQIEEIHKDGIIKFTKLQDIVEGQKDQLADALKKITHKSAMEGKEGEIDDPYYEGIQIAFTNYMKNQNGQLEPIMNNLIYPVMELTFEKYMNHVDANNILTICQIAVYNYQRIFQDKDHDYYSVSHWNAYYKEMSNIINTIIELEFKDSKFSEDIFTKYN